MTDKILKGEGGLLDCPRCQTMGSIEIVDADFPDHENEIKRLQCTQCGTIFTEHWKAVNWEEKV